MPNGYKLAVEWVIEKIVELDTFVAQKHLKLAKSLIIQLEEIHLAFTNMLFQMGVGAISQKVFNELLYDYTGKVSKDCIFALVDLLIVDTTLGHGAIKILTKDLQRWFRVFQMAQIDTTILTDGLFFYSQRRALYQAIEDELMVITEPFEFIGINYENDLIDTSVHGK